ncbi:MAG: hypothetical protein IPK44_01085 [Candidatus Accumulibacter sp.]|jgi:hypothetical protein|uniref:hypothetical protein n=1 Tax=Accumulibacter sp. TaxID=2053492 RepID=UPI0025832BF1|nr:hypothetical protein [Accumulibacter sp.]MBK8113192.1 hypothetical protein [Accumulibacter sp.]
MNKIVKVNLNINTDNTQVVEEEKKPWYVRAHARMSVAYDNAAEEIEESKRQLQLDRQVVKASYAASRAELDQLYIEQAKQRMIAIMAKKGITLTF